MKQKLFKTTTHFLYLFSFIFISSFAFQAHAAPRCVDYLSRSAQTKPKLNSENYNEVTDLKLSVFNTDNKKIASSLKEALIIEEVKQTLNGAHRSYEILLRAKIPAAQGGGKLMLVTLNLGSGNRAYNHVELVALLHANPELANALGIIRVEGHEDIVWVPDMQALNYRLTKLAKQYGFANAKWGYGAAEGVVSTLPYLKLLAKGKFPFSSEADVNLSIHDSMHSVAFAVLNITKGGREVLDVAKKRNQIILKIHERLQALQQGQYAQTFLENYAKFLSPDSLERTMLLTIIMTGNYDYFSAYNIRQQNKYFSLQNKNITAQRITELLKLFTRGQQTFAEVLNKLAPVNDPSRSAIQKIFTEELQGLLIMPDSRLAEAAQEILQFIPNNILRSTDESGSITPSASFSYTAAEPETLQ